VCVRVRVLQPWAYDCAGCHSSGSSGGPGRALVELLCRALLPSSGPAAVEWRCAACERQPALGCSRCCRGCGGGQQQLLHRLCRSALLAARLLWTIAACTPAWRGLCLQLHHHLGVCLRGQLLLLLLMLPGRSTLWCCCVAALCVWCGLTRALLCCCAVLQRTNCRADCV
jgi:hypothetical protein